MSGVFQNIDHPPPHRPTSVYAFGAGGGHTERGWGSIFWKTPDTALYFTYVSALCYTVSYSWSGKYRSQMSSPYTVKKG